MAFWDYQQKIIVFYETRQCDEYPGWQEIDCGCSNGLEWGGEQPRECSRCQGIGIIFHHIKSGALALYPGGPFCGRIYEKDL